MENCRETSNLLRIEEKYRIFAGRPKYVCGVESNSSILQLEPNATFP